ncbi:MAG: 23S rRNA (pseudouridine(1915)-N(3))-methyltransferase RlmH [Paludibacteraceae bacterium]|nr:23S rRNA (pseudouridine(1915)-N(3))-methyltransferase RlmH [Paludibacteraceae bacterium]
MKTTLLLVGKTTDEFINKLTENYVSRLKHYLDFELQVIPNLKNTKNLTEDQQKEKEGESILKALEGADTTILLDERGEQPTSTGFAAQMTRYQNQGVRRLVFVIGGPYGFSEQVYQRATGRLSLSKMTFSHQMVRLIFVEQLYRAMTIIKGEPYHHE